MNSETRDYEKLPSVKSAKFYGDITEEFSGEVELEPDNWLPHIWLNNVDLDEVVQQLDQDYDISSIKAVYPTDDREKEQLEVSRENREDVEEIGVFSGFGLETNGPVTYIEHPTQFTTGNGERGPAHHHANHYLETRVEKEVSNDPDTIERSLAIASDTLDVIEQREKERRGQIWSKWAEDTNYDEKGRVRQWFSRRFNGPKDGNVYLNPTAVIYDLDKTGLSAEQLLDASKQL
jgi:hypothetical protein